jgi:hypothetical protein
MAKGYWIGRVDVKNDEGYSLMPRPTHLSSKNLVDDSSCAPANLNAPRVPPARAMW